MMRRSNHASRNESGVEPGSTRPANRRGMTMVELIIAMVLGGVLMGAAVPLFISAQRGNDRQQATRTLQSQIHTTTEFLVRAVRNTEGIEAGSTAAELHLAGGEAAEACGVDTADPFRIHLTSAGLRCGSPSSSSPQNDRILATAVEGMSLRFGVDSDGDGRVDDFVADPSTVDPEDILAIRFQLEFTEISGQGPITTDVDFVAVLRGPTASRFILGGP